MESVPEISVIVPVYNAGDYLEPCIRSVLAQTFTNFELILVNDASTDGSGDICESFHDPRIRVIYKAQNGGVSAARNTGIAYAQGRYITFIDADDSLHPQFLEVCRGIDAEIVVTPFKIVDVHWHFEPSKNYGKVKATPSFYSPISAVEKALYQTGLTNCTWGMLYSREIFDNFEFSPGRYEDLDSFYKLFFRATRIAYIHSPLYYYTENPKSYMNVFTPERAVVLDVTERIVEYMAQHYPSLLPAAEDRTLSAAFNIFNLLAINNCDEPHIAQRCQSTILKYRRQSLLNPHVRLKNKLGILVTYIGGFNLLKRIAIWTK